MGWRSTERVTAIERNLRSSGRSSSNLIAARNRLLTLPVTVSRSRLLIREAWTYRRNLIGQGRGVRRPGTHLDSPLLTGDRRIGGEPNLPYQTWSD